MLYLFQSWRESLSLFIPKNFKLFLLVTIKSALELYGNLLYFFWWLIFSVIVFLTGTYYPAWAATGLLWGAIAETLLAALFFVLFMLVRPSVLPKGYAYFKRHIKKTGVGFLGLYVLVDWLRRELVIFPLQKVIEALFAGVSVNLFYAYMLFRLHFVPFLIFPPFICVVLFYFDSDGSLRAWFSSVFRGLKMYLYNLPFFALSMVTIFIIWYIIAHFLHHEVVWYILWLFIPFVLSYFKNMYVKRLHDQFNLYFANE